MIEVFIIPDGYQEAYYRQFGKLNRIEPIKLKDGNWALPTRIHSMLQKTYINLKSLSPDSKRLIKRKDVTKSIIDYAESTRDELSGFTIRTITKDDLDIRYFNDKAGPSTLLGKALVGLGNML